MPTLTEPAPPSLLATYPEGSVVPQEGADQPTWVVRREALPDLARRLRDDPETRFDMLLDVCGVDYPERPNAEGGRFEAVYHLYSLPRGERLRLKVPLTEADPVVPSLIGVWKAADWAERELWDMFGIKVEGHPNLRRILCHEGFVGHPLRREGRPGARAWW